MRERACEGCGRSISGRRQRCDDCRRDHRNAGQLARDRAARARGAQAEDFGSTDFDQADVVDYTGSAASRPPQFPGIVRPPVEPTREPEISDGRVPSPAERVQRLDLSRIPGEVRRDRVQAHKLAAYQQHGPEDGIPDMVSWDDLTAVNERFGGTVAFPASSMGVRQRVNHLGQSIPRARGGLR